MKRSKYEFQRRLHLGSNPLLNENSKIALNVSHYLYLKVKRDFYSNSIHVSNIKIIFKLQHIGFGITNEWNTFNRNSFSIVLSY